jgi:hypothetical protein
VVIFLLEKPTLAHRGALPESERVVFLASFPELSEAPDDEPAPPDAESPRSTVSRSNVPRSSTPAPSAESASSAITMPAQSAPTAPQGPVDWDMELKRSAQAMLDREQEKARQAAMFGGHPEVPESLRPPPPGGREFAWSYQANRFGGGAVRISEHCSLLLGLIPVCTIGKIPVRRDLFGADLQKAKMADATDYTHSRSLEPVDRETRIELQAIARLLGEWRAKRGSYPDDLTDLVTEAPAATQAPDGRLLIVDAWAHKVVYKHPSAGSACDYDLYSLGPDGVDDHGTRDDIMSCGSTPELSY